MDCGEEVSLLRARLSRVDGIRSLRFDVVRARMEVDYDEGRTSPPAIERAVESAGMKCEPWADEPRARAFDAAGLMVWLSGAALLSGMLAQGAASGEWIETLLAHNHSTSAGHDHEVVPLALFCFGLAICCGAAGVLRKAWTALRALRADMNLLVAVSVLGAAILGEWTEAATLSFLFALAGRLESASLGRARQAFAQLLASVPAQARLVHGDHEHLVEVSTITAGALVRVAAGEQIPCDGRIVSGRSFVNQALVTGESVAVERSRGDEVFAGSLNEGDCLEIRATRPASDSTVRRMLRMLEHSAARRSPSEQFIERFSRTYTPAVLALSLAVALLAPPLLGWTWARAAYQAMVVLLIACPCALVISTPVTVAAALASAARRGVLIKGGAFLEEAARLRAVVFGYEGVLSSGSPTLARLESLDAESAAALERFVHDSGHGWGACRLTPLSAAQAALPPRALALVDDFAAQGWLIEARLHAGAPALAALCDQPRPGARAFVDQLRRTLPVRFIALSSEPRPAVESAARAAGLTEVQAELSPDDLELHAAQLTTQLSHVALLAASASDAPALARASLGIAVGIHGPAQLRESADVVIMAGDPSRILFLIHHARAALAVIHQNIAIALALKALFLAAALLGWASLWMAVAADMGATFLVTFNGLRLLKPVEHPTP